MKRFRWALLVLGLTVAACGGGAASAAGEFGEVTVEGTSLPRLENPAADPAVGTAAPALSGSDFAGDTVSFTPGEGPAVLVFLAHWCPHCQAEVPRMVSWLEDNPDAGGVEVIAVPTGTDPTAPNFPPSVWLERENWPAPIIVDDADSTAGTAFGVGSYPFWVMVGSDGTVVGRLSGELGEDQIGELMTAVAGS